jgi:hypothetical protein
MLKIFLKIVIGLSSLIIISCSAKNSTHQVTYSIGQHIVDNQDGTLTDIRNRLQWTKIDSTPGPGYCYGGIEKDYRGMQWHVDCLNKTKYLGYNDWRMPTYQELENLLTTPEIRNIAFFNPHVHDRLKNHAYWSTAELAFLIYLRDLMIYNAIGPSYIYRRNSTYYVWPVRSDDKVKVASAKGK